MMALLELLMSIFNGFVFFFTFPSKMRGRARMFRERKAWYMILTEIYLWFCVLFIFVIIGYIIAYVSTHSFFLAELAPYLEWACGIMAGMLIPLGCTYSLGINAFVWHTDLDSELDEYRRYDVAAEGLSVQEWKEHHPAFRAWKTYGTPQAPYTAYSTNWYRSTPEDVFHLPYRQWYKEVRKNPKFRKWEKEHNARYVRYHFDNTWKGYKKSLEY